VAAPSSVKVMKVSDLEHFSHVTALKVEMVEYNSDRRRCRYRPDPLNECHKYL